MARPKHPKPEIEAAVQHAEQHGWTFVTPGRSAHAWGRLRCPEHSTDGCQMSVWSTPRSATNHARRIRQKVDHCPHGQPEQTR